MNSAQLLMLFGLLVSGSLIQPTSEYHLIPIEATSHYYTYHFTNSLAADSSANYFTQVASWQRQLR